MAPQQQPSPPPPRRFSLSDVLGSLFAGGIVTLFGAGGLLLGGTLLVIAILVIGLLLTYGGKGTWLLVVLFLAASVAVGLWIHDTDDEPQVALHYQRQAGIHGSACYATLEDTYARGLIPEKYEDAIYLGAFVNWYVPVGQNMQATDHHLGTRARTTS